VVVEDRFLLPFQGDRAGRDLVDGAERQVGATGGPLVRRAGAGRIGEEPRVAVQRRRVAVRDDEDEVSRRFIVQLSRLLEEAPTTSITPSERPVISPAMSALRASDLATSKAAYLQYRIADQQRWYLAKARRNEKIAGRWRMFLLIIEIAGIAAALAKAVGYVSVDIAGAIAAIIAAGTAWINLRQYTTLARADTFAVNELGIARRCLELVAGEAGWAAEVADAEEAVSREDTMWRASRSRTSS
jgi:hypothetical protein